MAPKASLLTAALLSAALLLASCTAGSRSEPRLDEEQQAARQEAAAELPEGFSRATQEIGEPTDGVTLQEIRTEEHDAFHRFVFVVEGEKLPVTRARLAEDEQLIEVAFHGVRMDMTGNRPLFNEAGEPFGELVTLDAPPVTSYGRRLVLDDSLVAYEIRLSRPADFRLHHEESMRILLDVAAAE